MRPLIPADPHRRNLAAGIILIAAAVIVIGGVIAGSYFLTIYTAKHQARQTAQQIEKARAAVLAKQEQGQIAGALRVCDALHGLAAIKGTHGNSGATYGAHLQTGLENVYVASGCPALLQKYGSHTK